MLPDLKGEEHGCLTLKGEEHVLPDTEGGGACVA